MKILLNDWENLNLLSNKNLERIVGSLVNRSSNAVLINMFEDSVILLDHETGDFYIADYTFDKNNLNVKLKNFEQVELIREENDFKHKIKDFFEDEEFSTAELAENYKDDVLEQDKFINELIKEAIATKDFSEVIDYSELKEINEDIEVKNEKFFKEYQKRLETNPLVEILLFDWVNPVNVSLIETESKKLINKKTIKATQNFWQHEDFREAFTEMSKTLIEDVEEGSEKFKALCEAYPSILWLDAADRKTLFGKTVLNSKELREDMKLIVDGLNVLFEELNLKEMRSDYINEDDSNCESPEDEIDETGKKKKKKKKKTVKEAEEGDSKEEKKDSEDQETPEQEAKELTPEQLQKLADDIKKVSEKVDDDKLKEKLNSIAKRLEKGKEEGTEPETVKEAVAILSI